MSNINKIEVNNAFYDIEDTEARNQIINLNNNLNNETNARMSAVNDVDTKLTALKGNLTASDNTEFRYEVREGKHGYLKADGSFVPFKSGFEANDLSIKESGDIGSNVTKTYTAEKEGFFVISVTQATKSFAHYDGSEKHGHTWTTELKLYKNSDLLGNTYNSSSDCSYTNTKKSEDTYNKYWAEGKVSGKSMTKAIEVVSGDIIKIQDLTPDGSGTVSATVIFIGTE